VATVSGNGLTATVNAVGAGTAEITVTTSNGKTAAATVVVTTPRTNKYQLKVRNLKTSGLNGATTADNPLILGWDTDTWTGTLNLSNAESNANVGTLVNSTLVYLDTPLEPPLVFKVKATITGSDSSGNTGFWTGVFVNPEADAYTNLNGLRHLSSGVVRHNYMRNDGITAQNASYPTASKGSEYTYQISWDGADYISTFTAGGTDYPRNPSDEADTLKNAEAVYPGFFVVRQDITITEITIVNNTGPRELFVATNGSDSNSGTIGEPLATLAKAQELAAPGYTVYIRGGTYVIPESQIAAYWNSDVYACVFNMNKSGTADKRITYAAYPGDSRPVFDLSNVKPASKRVIGFHVTGSYLTFKGFDVTGVQVTILEHTQSESFRVGGNSAANNNIFENLAMHDSMAIGLYLYKGSNNLVLNCDAYDNWDSVSEGGSGENTDGFGGHPQTGSVNNVFRGCRAWRNADDGFDLIRAWEAVTIENCWAAYNGYSLTAGELVSRANGIGIKAGGWGMEAEESVPASIPRHTVRFSLSAENKNHGFYANHHLGGINWYNNTAYRNSNNFNMTNRKSLAEVVDVNGYGHVLKNNLSYRPRGQSGAAHLTNIDNAQCTLTTNSFELALEDSHFQSLDASQMLGARNADGSLPSITFMKPAAGSPVIDAGTIIGYTFTGAAPDMGYTE
jgi:parallel beta-helix repeat protein